MPSKNHNNIFYTKEQELSRVREALKDVAEYKVWDSREKYTLRHPISVKKRTYLDVRMHHENENNRQGFSLEVNDCTHKITGGTWYATKDGIYQEVLLTHEELRLLDKCYGFSDNMEYLYYCKEE